MSLGAGSWWPEAPGPAGEVTAAGQADIWVPRGNEEVEDSMVGANWGLNKYLQTTGKPLGHLKGRGLAVPSEPVVDLIQVSAQEYRERHEAELK